MNMREWRLTCGCRDNYQDGTVTCSQCGTWIKYRWGPGIGTTKLKCPVCGAVIYSSPTSGPQAGWGFVILNYKTPSGSSQPGQDTDIPKATDQSDGQRSDSIGVPPIPSTVRSGLRQTLVALWKNHRGKKLRGTIRLFHALGIWVKTKDGRTLCLLEPKIPKDWLVEDYWDFVNRVAGHWNVEAVGQIVGPFACLGAKYVGSTSELLHKLGALGPVAQSPTLPANIQSGLAQLLLKCLRDPGKPLSWWKGFSACGLWFEHADGTVWKLPEGKIPSHWTAGEYAQYVLSIARSPHVVRIGQIGEFLGIPVFFKQAIQAANTEEFKERAWTPPETIQPQPEPTPEPEPPFTPLPEPAPEPAPQPSPAPSPEPTPGPTPGPSPQPSPIPQPFPQPPLQPWPYAPPYLQGVSWDKVILYGGIALVGLGLIFLLRRK